LVAIGLFGGSVRVVACVFVAIGAAAAVGAYVGSVA
jgi:hypothetical protein